MTRRLLVVLFAVAFSACLEGDRDQFFYEGCTPVVLPPPDTPLYGYDGTRMRKTRGGILVNVSDTTNKGYVDTAFEGAPGERWAIKWTRFQIQPAQEWQDGGVATHLTEHGASGQGNKMEPQFHVILAGWGTTSDVRRNGEPYRDPITGNSTFNAHFMVTQAAMLEEGSHRVYKKDRTTPFDPRTPGDGHVFEGRGELHFAAWGADAYKNGIAQPRPPPVTNNFTDTITATYTRSHPFVVDAVGSSLEVQIRLNGGGQATFQLKDPQGRVVSQATLNPTASSATLAPAPGPLSLGNYTLDVTATGAQASYSAQATVIPPRPFLVHAVFTEFHSGVEEREAEDESSLACET